MESLAHDLRTRNSRYLDRDGDPMLPPGRNFCKCALCGLYFKSVKAFDVHLIGVGLDRGCMPEAECSGLGLERDLGGYWRLPKRKFQSIHLRAVT